MKYFKLRKKMMTWEAGLVFSEEQIPDCLLYNGVNVGDLTPIVSDVWEETTEEEYENAGYIQRYEETCSGYNGNVGKPHEIVVVNGCVQDATCIHCRKRFPNMFENTSEIKTKAWDKKELHSDAWERQAKAMERVDAKVPQDDNEIIIEALDRVCGKRASKDSLIAEGIDMDEIERYTECRMSEILKTSDAEQVKAFLVLKELTRRLQETEEKHKRYYTVGLIKMEVNHPYTLGVYPISIQDGSVFAFTKRETAQRALTLGHKYWEVFYNIT